MTKPKQPDELPPLKSVSIPAGAYVLISHVSPEGYSDFGRGKAQIRKIGTSRVITIQVPDGEIRIVVL